MTTIRVAVAGTCRLALLIAQEIQESTSHQVIILSRIVSKPRSALTPLVNSRTSLHFAYPS